MGYYRQRLTSMLRLVNVTSSSQKDQQCISVGGSFSQTVAGHRLEELSKNPPARTADIRALPNATSQRPGCGPQPRKDLRFINPAKHLAFCLHVALHIVVAAEPQLVKLHALPLHPLHGFFSMPFVPARTEYDVNAGVIKECCTAAPPRPSPCPQPFRRKRRSSSSGVAVRGARGPRCLPEFRRYRK